MLVGANRCIHKRLEIELGRPKVGYQQVNALLLVGYFQAMVALPTALSLYRNACTVAADIVFDTISDGKCALYRTLPASLGNGSISLRIRSPSDVWSSDVRYNPPFAALSGNHSGSCCRLYRCCCFPAMYIPCSCIRVRAEVLYMLISIRLQHQERRGVNVDLSVLRCLLQEPRPQTTLWIEP